jgi:hypothetical protein
MKARARQPEADVIHLDRLLGRQVLARNNRPVGRLEEFRVEERNGTWRVIEYVIGKAGLLERLGVGVRLVLGLRVQGHVARWDQLDISDPDRPRLTCAVEELRQV